MGSVVIVGVEGGIDPKSGEVRRYCLHDVADHDRALVSACVIVFRGKCPWPRFVKHRSWTSPTGKTTRRLSALGAIQLLCAAVLRSATDNSIVHHFLDDFDHLIVRLVEIGRKALSPLLTGASVTAHRQH